MFGLSPGSATKRDPFTAAASRAHLLVVLHALLEELPGRLHVVQVGVEVGEEDGHLAAGAEKVGDLKVWRCGGVRRRALSLSSCAPP